jgi:C4-dicarboxylate-specific signal transduction histidine kinase
MRAVLSAMAMRGGLPSRTRGVLRRLVAGPAVFFLAGLAAQGLAATTGNVLVLYSNNRLLPANIEIDRGLRETIAQVAGRNVSVFAEFLGAPVFSGQAFEQDTAHYLRRKYSGHPPQVVVVAGDEAFEFVLRWRPQLFPDAPVVHVAVGKPLLDGIASLPPDVIGVPIEVEAAGTIVLALRWHPDARRLVVVTGASPWDREREARLRAMIPKLGLHRPVEFLAGLPTDALLKRLGELGRGDVVYTQGYYRDGAGREFLPRDAVAAMTRASGAPVYGPYPTFIGTGVVGGRMPVFTDMGREAGRNVHRLLDGVRPSAIQLPAVVPTQVQVDWRAARRWAIPAARIPPDAVVHFREPTFWEAYRGTAIVGGIVILLQAGLIAALLLERRRRLRTATALEESELRMGMAAQAARLSMWMWDLTRGKARAAARPEDRDSLLREQPVAFDEVIEAVHPADRERFAREVRLAAGRAGELDVEYRAIEPDGAVRWFAARGHACRPEVLTGVRMDITARKEAELQAEKDRSALTHLTRVSVMGELSASIAHQINQPLSVLVGNAEVARAMLDRAQIDRAELQEICDDMVAASVNAAEIVRRLSALYKRGELTLVPVDLNELVGETLDLVRTGLMNRHVEAQADLAPGLPLVDGGRIQLQQVLLNLILNGADAMAACDPGERRLLVRTACDAAGVRLEVIDQGTGIAPGHADKVFEAFWSTKSGGTGVGLAICLSIVKAHRGTLTAHNNPERGATFRVCLPAGEEGAT